MGRETFTKMWYEILGKSVHANASDIHFGPESEAPHQFHLNFRIHGLLVKQTSYQQALGSLLIDHLKHQAGLDVAERTQPQDGRLASAHADFRVSTLPCLGGEKAVLRILRRANRPKLAQLGLDVEAELQIRKALDQSAGLIVIAGATGSGKTTTIHSLLAEIDSATLNVVTLEDPVEYRAAGLSQVQISRELTFSKGLRSLLRQDPDVIFVGECRDAETATLALEAAGTGHLVLTTVHAGSIAQITHRLIELACDKDSVARVLIFSAFQQLIPSNNGRKLDFQWKSYL